MSNKAPFMGAIPYTGNKQKLLPFLLELFPKKDSYDKFVDLFAGGLSVSLTMSSFGKEVIANEYNPYLIELYEAMKEWKDLSHIHSLIEQYGLCKTNKDAYMHFRDEVYNKDMSPDKLFALILHSFSNIDRRNNDGLFNVPFGYRSLNSNTEKRFKHFKEHCGNISFRCGEYYGMGAPAGDEFVYCDPPYSITDATYNKDWNEESDENLFHYLDRLNETGVKWGMSNVIVHRGRINKPLIQWMKKYNVHYLESKYVLGFHCLTEEELSNTVEIYVCNY